MSRHTATVSGNPDSFAISRVEGPPPSAVPAPDPAVEAERRQAEQFMRSTDEQLGKTLTRDDAIKLRATLMADEGWSKRFLGGSPDRMKQIQKLDSVINENPNVQGESAREIEHMREKYDLPPEAVDHVRENKVVSASEKYAAQQKRRELMGDKEFVRAYMSGSLKEQRTMTMLNIIIASPLAEAQ